MSRGRLVVGAVEKRDADLQVMGAPFGARSLAFCARLHRVRAGQIEALQVVVDIGRGAGRVATTGLAESPVCRSAPARPRRSG